MRWILIIGAIVVISTLSMSVFLQPNDLKTCDSAPSALAECKKADAIVVVSGGDTVARTNAGIERFKNGWADALVLSGAAQDKTGPSNAAAMKQQAIAAGVPESAIFIEEDAANTQENAANSQTIFSQQGFKDIILVTSGYHQRRASIEFNKRTDGVTIRSAPVMQDKDWSPFWWLTFRGWWLAGGELAKIAASYLGTVPFVERVQS